MKRLAWIAVLLAVFPGCGERAAPPAPTPESAQAGAPAEPPALMEGTMSLYLYDTHAGEGDRPRFEVRDTEVRLGADGEAHFENAHAIIYARDGAETHLYAGEGRLDEARGLALLSGGVRMEQGPRQVELEEVEWNNDERVARSDKPVTLRDGETEVAAASMEFHPDTKMLILRDFKAHLSYGGSSVP